MPDYTIEVRKSIGAYAWANTWHLRADSLTEAIQGGSAIATFERALLSSQCMLEEFKTSPWLAGTTNQFTVTNVGAAGQRSTPLLEPAEMCLLAKISTGVGRPGAKWFRLSLDEADVTQSSGKAILATNAGVIAAFVTAAGTLQDTLDGLGLNLLVGTIPLLARVSSNLLVINGVGMRQREVGWYNKGP